MTPVEQESRPGDRLRPRGAVPPIIIILLILTVTFYWKLALTDQFTFLENPDLAYQVLPWYQFEARAMRRATLPLWDPFEWCGQSVLGQMQPGAAFPLNWPLFLAPFKDGHLNFTWVHLHFVFLHWLAAIFMYAFCRQMGSSRFAGIVAGAAFSFGGYLGTTPWPQMIEGALWIPLVFLFFHRMVEHGWGRAGVANASLCGAAMGLALLSGHHQAPLFTGLALAALALYFVLGKRSGGTAALCGVVVVFAFLIAAVQLLPAWEYGSRAYRWVADSPPVRMADTVPYLAQYKQGIFPLSFLGTLFSKAHLTNDPFVGFVCLSFAIFAVAAGWNRPQVRIYSILGLGALAYSAGYYSLLHGLVYTVAPLVDKARSPGHAIFVFQFAALTLAAQGIDLFLGPQQQRRAASRAAPGFSPAPVSGDPKNFSPDCDRWRSRIWKALVVIGLLSWASLYWLYLNQRYEKNPGDHVMLSSLVVFLLAAILYGFHRELVSGRTVRISLVLLLLFELSIASQFFFSHRDDAKRALYLKALSEHAGLMNFLKAQPRPFRFDVASPQDFPANLGDWEGLESTHGYLASVSADLYDFVGWDWDRSALLLNTVYVIAKQPTRAAQSEVFAGAGGWKIYRNEDAFPRAWVVHSIRAARDSQEAASIFRSADFDPGRETILIGAAAEVPALAPCREESRIEFIRRTIHRTTVRILSSCGGMVVFAEPAFPGWRARVDGTSAPLYAPFGALRGVVVPAGTHTIDLRYRPLSVYVGAVLSMVGLLACAGLVWRARSQTAAASR